VSTFLVTVSLGSYRDVKVSSHKTLKAARVKVLKRKRQCRNAIAPRYAIWRRVG
jgi:hypothetical protein